MAIDRGIVLESLSILLIILSTVVIVCRIYVRGFMINVFGWDDSIAVLAYAVLITQAALEIRAANHGSGQHMAAVSAADLKVFFHLLPTMQLLYLLATGLVRLSIAVFLPRLSKDRNYMCVIYALGFFIISTTVICFSLLLFSCRHVPDLWSSAKATKDCRSPKQEAIIFNTHGALGLATDIGLLIVPLWIIRSKMILSKISKKSMIVFFVGIFVIIAASVRLGIIVGIDLSKDLTYLIPLAAYFTLVEAHTGLWVACFPTLQPLIRLVAHKVGIGGSKRAGYTSNVKRSISGFHGDSHIQISARNHAKRGSTILQDGPDDCESQIEILMKASRDGGGAFQLQDLQMSKEVGITKTTHVEVTSAARTHSDTHEPHSWNAM